MLRLLPNVFVCREPCSFNPFPKYKKATSKVNDRAIAETSFYLWQLLFTKDFGAFCFNGISTVVVYAKAIPVKQQLRYYSTHSYG